MKLTKTLEKEQNIREIVKYGENVTKFMGKKKERDM